MRSDGCTCHAQSNLDNSRSNDGIAWVQGDELKRRRLRVRYCNVFAGVEACAETTTKRKGKTRMKFDIYKASNGLFYWQVLTATMTGSVSSVFGSPVVAVSGHGYPTRDAAQNGYDSFAAWVRSQKAPVPPSPTT